MFKKILGTLFAPIVRPFLLKVGKDMGVWGKAEGKPGLQNFGPGCRHDWPWYFEGTSNVHVKSVKEIC